MLTLRCVNSGRTFPTCPPQIREKQWRRLSKSSPRSRRSGENGRWEASWKRRFKKKGEVNLLQNTGWSSQMRTRNWPWRLIKNGSLGSLTRTSFVEWCRQTPTRCGCKRKWRGRNRGVTYGQFSEEFCYKKDQGNGGACRIWCSIIGRFYK